MSSSRFEGSDAIAYVRLHRYESAKYEGRGESSIQGPTGRTYYFDGPHDDGTSPWVPLYPQHREDMELFRQFKEFELVEKSDE